MNMNAAAAATSAVTHIIHTACHCIQENRKGSGVGRRLLLNTPVSLSELVVRVKNHLGLSSVRLAKGRNCEDSMMVKSAAICAGSG